MLKEAATIICNCLNITDKDIENAFHNGARTWEQLQNATKIGTVCGKCEKKAMELMHEFAHIYGM
jgi:nitrogen fixation NifU-like protein